MAQGINLKELERKAWRSVFQDGLWDIYLGLLLLAMAINALLSDMGVPEGLSTPLYVVLVLLAMAVLWAGKRFITTPRMGRVKFGQRRQARLRWLRVALAASVLVGLLVFLVTLAPGAGRPAGQGLIRFFPAVWAVSVLALAGLGAYLLDYPRLVLIGAMYALAPALDLALRKLTGLDLSLLAFALPATVILLVGVAVLIRFLRDYPLPVEPSPSQGTSPETQNSPEGSSAEGTHGRR
jgi:hypothetical protein